MLDIDNRSIDCEVCGAKLEFAPRQWSKACSCGTMIFWPLQLQKKESEIQIDAITGEARAKQPGCFLCNDTGLVAYTAQTGTNKEEYIAKCVCNAGAARIDAYPLITECNNVVDLNYLEQVRRESWEKRNSCEADLRAIFLSAKPIEKNLSWNDIKERMVAYE